VSLGFCQRCGTALVPRFQEDRERPTCPACGFVQYVDPKVAVAVVIGTRRGVLLGRRCIDPGAGRWSFPAGYVNRGEVLEEAAAREVLEELSVAVHLTGLVGVYSERGGPVVLVVYAGEIVSGEPNPDGREVSDAQWFPLDALPADLAFPHDRRVLGDWKRAVETGSLLPQSMTQDTFSATSRGDA
jgi:ADP-ribose pyrophosphatase YjhB (NUDIX family)